MRSASLFCRFYIVFLLITSASLTARAESIQQPVAAGTFYPADPEVLEKQVDGYLSNAFPQKVEGDIAGLISPHAGYIYSGAVAAYGFKEISGERYDTVVIIGPSHRLVFDGAAVIGKDYYETPLGKVPVDKVFEGKLVRAEKATIRNDPRVFSDEHSVEVQVPFLQRSLKDFMIVPVVIGRPDYVTCRAVARGIAKTARGSGKRVLIIASTDLSHYLKYDDALLRDQATLSEMLNYDPVRFARKVAEGECELCGSAPVITAMLACGELGADRITLLKYSNSGDTAGDKSRVVGYGSLVIYRSEDKKMLDASQKKVLLGIARETIESRIKTKKVPEFNVTDPALTREQGAFVTIRKDGQLRGCIGNIIGRQPLYLTVRDMAVESATGDPRFAPVRPDELKDINIEISVLSEPEPVTDVSNIEMGVHGVIVKRGYRSGVFLPQVAVETGWGRDEFLSNLCESKAGLPADAWKDKKTQVYSFTAQVFSEGGK